MPRYYESESLIDFVKQNTPHINGETTMECVERAIQKAPTADVVPKSEYDAVVSAVDNSTKEFLKLHDKYQEAKREIENLKVLLEMKDVSYAGLEELYDTDTAALIEAREKTEVEVARAFRQRMNEKMGKHTHLLGKEYVQRIMREVEKELIGEKDA